MIMSIFLVFMTVSALAILGLNVAGIITHKRISFFLGGIGCEILALIPLVIAMVLGLGHRAAMDPNNFMPFVLFMALFFIPAGLLSALIGIYEPAEDTVEPQH